MSEAKLHKLKVTELKELLSKNGLLQSGKKDDLVKRLVDAGVSVDGEDGQDDELLDVPDELDAPAVPAPVAPVVSAPDAAPPAAPPAVTVTAAPAAPAPASAAADASAAEPASESSPEPEIELTEEQKKQKARAERFGMPWNPPKPKPKPQPKAAPAAPAANNDAALKVDTAKREKAPAIDRSPLGESADVLARRAAKFGLPAKKAEAAVVAQVAPAAPAAPSPEKKTVELTPEMAEKLAQDEEKKRKRAEKFGLTKPQDNGSAEDAPDAKKAKV